MREDTPLLEVVQHLPASIAGILMAHTTEIQVGVLATVRAIICHMEAKGAQLDPVSYEAVISGVAALALATQLVGTELAKANGEIAHLKGGSR